VLAERNHLDMPQAFALLRDHARRTNQKLSTVALAVVHSEIDIPPTDSSTHQRLT
jgi:AmiR/NasT family two-component response regulator